MGTINGVDTRRVGQLVEGIIARPELAQMSFTLGSEWTGGFTGASKTGALRQAGEADESRTVSFAFESDEPPALLGDDTAASAGDYALQALAACYAVTFAANAAAREIELESLSLELEGDLDLHGFLGLDAAVRPGLSEIRVTARVESPNATRQQLEQLVRAVEERSPIRDTLASPVRVVTNLAP